MQYSGSSMKELPLPRKEILFFPRDAGETEHYPSIEDPASFRQWFAREGYVLVRGAVHKNLCDTGVQAFESEVLHDRKAFLSATLRESMSGM